MSDITYILAKIESGDRLAAEQLLPLVYEELRRLAATKLSHEKPGQTLQATSLIHEAYVRLVDQSVPQQWENQRYFFAAAAEAMRRILVDNARRKQSETRGGGRVRVALSDLDPAATPTDEDLVALHEAIERLEANDRQKAQVVRLRYFAGWTVPQVAERMEVSTSTVDNYWAIARAWLRVEMT